MKNVFLVWAALISAIALISCGNDCVEPKKCEVQTLFRVAPNDLIFGSGDIEPQAIFVNTLNVNWKVEVEASAQSWLKTTEESDKVQVRVEENSDLEMRTGTVTIIPDLEGLAPVVVTVTQSALETIHIPLTTGVLVFAADRYNCGISNYVLSLAGGDAEYDQEYGEIYITDGYTVGFDLLTEELQYVHYQKIDLNPGTYNISMDQGSNQFEYEPMSFLGTFCQQDVGITKYLGSLISRFEKGAIVENIVITSGKITVTNEEDNYTIMADLMSSRGQRIVMDYSLPLDDKISSVSISTFQNELEMPDPITGSLTFNGEIWGLTDCYKWTIQLQSPALNNGAKLVLVLYSPNTNPLVLNDGEYVLKKSNGKFTAEVGWVEWLYDRGCWVYQYDADAKLSASSPLIEGSVQVTGLGNNKYTFEIDAWMDNYFKVSGSADVELSYSDKSQAVAESTPTGVGADSGAGSVRSTDDLVVIRNWKNRP